MDLYGDGMKRVYYEELDSCIMCPNNFDGGCWWGNDGEKVNDDLFKNKCKLPKLEEVERFTRYVSANLILKVHGNCRNWTWHSYTEDRKTDYGWCKRRKEFIDCNEEDTCEGFVMVGELKGQKLL